MPNVVAGKSRLAHLGGWTYPILDRFRDWVLTSCPLDDEHLEDWLAQPDPTLRWVKDDKVIDLVVRAGDSALSLEGFQELTGLRLHTASAKSSKRISRIFRPSLYWELFRPGTVSVVDDPDMDEKTWDGMGWIAASLVDKLMGRAPWEQCHRPGRVQITVQDQAGQRKGDALVMPDHVVGADLRFPAGGIKREVTLEGATLVDIRPTHARRDWWIDVQSLINLYPFFEVEQLLEWLRAASDQMLTSIANGQAEAQLAAMADEEEQAPTDWVAARYIAEGGRLADFASILRQVANQHTRRMISKTLPRFRIPIPGGCRLYIAVASTAGISELQPGQVLLDFSRASLFVPDQEWEAISETLGGCDQDDALSVILFRDEAEDGRVRCVYLRNPNEEGQRLVGEPVFVEELDVASLPILDSRKLPPHVSQLKRTYGELHPHPELQQPVEACTERSECGGYFRQLDRVIQVARANQGVLGQYINVITAHRLIRGQYPEVLPATTEQVIDGAVKDFLDLSPVGAWNVETAESLAQAEMPAEAARRLRGVLGRDAELRLSDGSHWIDRLTAAIQAEIDRYSQAVDELANRCLPPVEVLQAGSPHLEQGRAFRQVYNQVIWQVLRRGRKPGDADFEAAAQACQAHLAQFSPEKQRQVLLGAVTLIYLEGPSPKTGRLSDASVWQPGHVATTLLDALRELGVIGPDCQARRVQGSASVTVRSVWFKLLTGLGYPFAEPQEVPATMRSQAEARVSKVADQVTGKTFRVLREEDATSLVSLATWNPLGYLPAEQVKDLGRVRVVLAVPAGGDLQAILAPML
jgi:hypothetical protein